MGTIGGLAHLINDVAHYTNILPRDPRETDIYFLKVKKSLVEGDSGLVVEKVFPIRPHYVKEALDWLCIHNIHYKNGQVKVCYKNLDYWAQLSPQFVSIPDNIKLPTILNKICDCVDKKNVLAKKKSIQRNQI